MSLIRPLTRGLVQPLTRPLIGRNLGGDALTPAVKALFASGEKGVMFDFVSAANLYTDSARTTLVSASGDGIGSATDLSGNGKHASSAGSARPTWSNSGGGAFGATTDAFDDYLQAAAIDFSATDAVTVVASFRKSSDAIRQLVLELSPSIATAGSFSIEAPATAGQNRIDAFQTGATTTRAATASGAPYAAPLTCVTTVRCDLTAPNISNYFNGALIASNTAATGGGNFSNNALNIGARNTISLFFNGRIYRLLVIGRALTSTERNTAERWAAQPVGIAIP